MPGEKDLATIDECKAALAKAKGKDKGLIYIRMGDAYNALKQNNKALPCYLEAYDSGQTDPEFIIRLTEALAGAGKAEKSIKILENAIAGVKDLLLLGKLYTKAATISRLIENYEPGLRMAMKAIETVEMIPGKSPDVQKVLAEAHMVAGNLHWRTGDKGKAMQSFHKALELYKILDDKKGLADIYNYMGIMHLVGGEPSKALEFFERSEQLLDRSRINLNRGQIKLLCGNFKGAEEEFRTAIKKGHEEGYNSAVIIGQIDMAEMYLEMENPAKAKTWIEMAHKSLQGLEKDPHLSSVLEIMARVDLKEGKVKSARENIDRSMALAKANNAKSEEVWCHYVNGLVLEAEGKLEASRKELDECLAVVNKSNHVRLVGLVSKALARIFQRLGLKKDARAASDEAKKCFKKIGALYLIKRMDEDGN